MTLAEFSKRGRRVRRHPSNDAHIEVGLKMWFPRGPRPSSGRRATTASRGSRAPALTSSSGASTSPASATATAWTTSPSSSTRPRSPSRTASSATDGVVALDVRGAAAKVLQGAVSRWTTVNHGVRTVARPRNYRPRGSNGPGKNSRPQRRHRGPPPGSRIFSAVHFSRRGHFFPRDRGRDAFATFRTP